MAKTKAFEMRAVQFDSQCWVDSSFPLRELSLYQREVPWSNICLKPIGHRHNTGAKQYLRNGTKGQRTSAFGSLGKWTNRRPTDHNSSRMNTAPGDAQSWYLNGNKTVWDSNSSIGSLCWVKQCSLSFIIQLLPSDKYHIFQPFRYGDAWSGNRSYIHQLRGELFQQS